MTYKFTFTPRFQKHFKAILIAEGQQHFKLLPPMTFCKRLFHHVHP